MAPAPLRAAVLTCRLLPFCLPVAAFESGFVFPPAPFNWIKEQQEGASIGYCCPKL